MAFTSIRAQLAKAFGFGKRPRTVIPRTRSAQYVAAFGGDPMRELQKAIDLKNPVSFFYNDKWQPEGVLGKYGTRVGNPHAIWRGKNGTVYLHLYVDPQSASATGDLPGWRTFIISRIQNVSVFELGSRMFGRPVQFVTAPGWNPGWYFRVGTPLQMIDAEDVSDLLI
jgi:hypothetical protein